MVAYTKEKIKKLLELDFIRFCIVGGTGFVINFIILIGLHKVLHLPVFISQLIGAEIALFSNFMLHHHWTYKKNHVEKTLPQLLLQFHATSWPAILGSAAMVSLGEKYLNLSNLFALVLTSIVVFVWNYVWSKFVVWKDVKTPEIKEIIK